MKTVAEVIGVLPLQSDRSIESDQRNGLAGRRRQTTNSWQRSRRGYRRVHAILKRQALAAGLKPPNHKRVYRVMKVHGLLLDRHAGGVERRHDGRIAVDARCSNGFEIGCDNCLRPAAPQVSRPCPNHWK